MLCPLVGPRIPLAEDTADNSPLEAHQPSGTNPRQNHPPLKQVRDPVLGGADLQVQGALRGPPQGRAGPAARPQDSQLSLQGLYPNSREGNGQEADGGGHPAWGWPPTPTCFPGKPEAAH